MDRADYQSARFYHHRGWNRRVTNDDWRHRGASILPVLSDKMRKRKIFIVIACIGAIPGLPA